MAVVMEAVGSDNDCDHSGMQCRRRGYGVLVGISGGGDDHGGGSEGCMVRVGCY